MESSQSIASQSKATNEAIPQRDVNNMPTKKIMFISCALLSLILAGSGGYYIGRQGSINDKSFTGILLKPSQMPSNINSTSNIQVSPQPITKCYVPKNFNYAINNSPTIDKWCEIRVFYGGWGEDMGYRLNYPSDWEVNLRGSDGVNLSLEKDKKWMIFVSVEHTNLAVENYDKIERGIEGSEIAPPTTVIDPEYKIISKEITVINGKRILKVLTIFENTKYTYYLIDNGVNKDKAVYAVRIHEEVTEDYANKILKSFTPEFL